MLIIAAAFASALQGVSAVSPPAREDRMVCRSRPATGTRFPTRTCRLQTEWDRISEQHRRDFKEIVDAPRGQSDKNPGL